MGNKGDIKTQHQYENEVELRELYKEAYLRGEMTQQQIFCSLVFMLGFGKTKAKSLILSWKQELGLYEAQYESNAVKKRRGKRQISLEKKSIARRDRGLSKEAKKEAKEKQRECSNCQYYEICVNLLG